MSAYFEKEGVIGDNPRRGYNPTVLIRQKRESPSRALTSTSSKCLIQLFAYS